MPIHELSRASDELLIAGYEKKININLLSIIYSVLLENFKSSSSIPQKCTMLY